MDLTILILQVGKLRLERQKPLRKGQRQDKNQVPDPYVSSRSTALLAPYRGARLPSFATLGDKSCSFWDSLL